MCIITLNINKIYIYNAFIDFKFNYKHQSINQLTAIKFSYSKQNLKIHFYSNRNSVEIQFYIKMILFYKN